MRGNNNQSGYTMMELMIVISMVAIVASAAIGVFVLAKGNMWYSEGSAYRQLQAEHPSITKLVKSERNVFSESVFTVVREGDRVDYCLDTDVLWNYRFSECD